MVGTSATMPGLQAVLNCGLTLRTWDGIAKNYDKHSHLLCSCRSLDLASLNLQISLVIFAVFFPNCGLNLCMLYLHIRALCYSYI